MEEPETSPEREAVVEPYRKKGYVFQRMNPDFENEIWMNKETKKVFIYCRSDHEIVGPTDILVNEDQPP